MIKLECMTHSQRFHISSLFNKKKGIPYPVLQLLQYITIKTMTFI